MEQSCAVTLTYATVKQWIRISARQCVQIQQSAQPPAHIVA